MAAVERIEQAIAGLGHTADALAEEFRQAYSEYLQALGQALRKQIVLSGYHVCTQGYPTQFLALSLSQRQALQQSLQGLAKESQGKLVALLQQDLKQLTEADSNLDADEGIELGQSSIVEFEADDPAILAANISEDNHVSSILALVEWQEAMELAIEREIRTASSKANRLLHQSGILPNKLPAFLKATSNIDASQMEAISQNMLDLLMEAQNRDHSDEDEDDSSMPQVAMIVQLVAIHLKLSEVEFADGTTTVLRNKLRSLTARLKTLKKTYRKKERELAIARAEDAWRSSWYEGV